MASYLLKGLRLSDVPVFHGYDGEDAEYFLLRFVRFTEFLELNEDERVQLFPVALMKNAAIWFQHEKPCANWQHLKSNFLKMFGKSAIDFDLIGPKH